jgi:hypothetical protein
VISCLQGLAEVAHGRGDLAGAEAYLTRAIDLLPRLTVPDAARTELIGLAASVARERGNDARADSLEQSHRVGPAAAHDTAGPSP